MNSSFESTPWPDPAVWLPDNRLLVSSYGQYYTLYRVRDGVATRERHLPELRDALRVWALPDGTILAHELDVVHYCLEPFRKLGVRTTYDLKDVRGPYRAVGIARDVQVLRHGMPVLDLPDVSWCALHPDDDVIAVLRTDRVECLGMDGRVLWQGPEEGRWGAQLLWSPRGDCLLCNNHVFYSDGTSRRLPTHSHINAAWTPTGSHLLAAEAYERDLLIFDATDWSRPPQTVDIGRPVRRIAVSGNGRDVAVLSEPGNASYQVQLLRLPLPAANDRLAEALAGPAAAGDRLSQLALADYLEESGLGLPAWPARLRDGDRFVAAYFLN